MTNTVKKQSKKEQFRKELSERFIETLEEAKKKGSVDFWESPWCSSSAPMNGRSLRPYHGINRWWLTFISQVLEYQDPRWYTFNQIADTKGVYHKGETWHLKKGSKGTLVEYWRAPFDATTKKPIKDDDEFQKLKDQGHKVSWWFPFYSTVFNASCIEGIKPYDPKDYGAGGDAVNPDEVIRKIADGMNVPILEDQLARAYYSPDKDEVHLPKREYFRTSEAYNATALHELTHSTGNASRLNREIKNWFGSEKYAFEELVAELGSAYASQYLQAGLGKKEFDNSVSYIDSWIDGIQKNPDALVKAMNLAAKAADYMAEKAGIIDVLDEEETDAESTGNPVSIPDQAEKESAAA